MNNRNESGACASDLMSKDVVYVKPDATLSEAARSMEEFDIGALPVCENHRLVGVITDRDITVRAVSRGQDPTTTEVAEAMTDEVRWCYDDTPEAEIVELMERYELRRIPVIDRSKNLVGIVALADLAHSGARDETKARGLEGVSRA